MMTLRKPDVAMVLGTQKVEKVCVTCSCTITWKGFKFGIHIYMMILSLMWL